VKSSHAPTWRAALLLVLAAGCSGLKLTSIKMAQQRPSNVAVYFKVRTSDGAPVGGLTADRFRIYEDGQLVSQYESKQTILNPSVAAVHYTLLLVDMSGSVSESGNGPVIVQAVSAFTDRVEKDQRIGIYAFDGTPDLTPIVPFTDQPGNAKTAAQQLGSFKPKDPSTNLNGAVVKALDELDNALGKASQPMKFGTLVVFTDGTDRANRVPVDVMRQHVREKPFDVFAIGLGAEIKPEQLREIGKSGTSMATDRNAVVKAFDDIGAQVDGYTKSYYLLSYCSPSRAGKHEVEVEAVLRDDKDKKSEETGSLKSEFDATGFAPGCDPNSPPSFDVTKGDTLAPPPEDKDSAKKDEKRAKEEKKDEKKEEKKADKKEEKKEEKRAEKKQPSKTASPPSAPRAAPASAAAPPPAAPPPPASPPPPPPEAPAPKPPQDFNP
jgi:hypothetical protein